MMKWILAATMTLWGTSYGTCLGMDVQNSPKPKRELFKKKAKKKTQKKCNCGSRPGVSHR